MFDLLAKFLYTALIIEKQPFIDHNDSCFGIRFILIKTNRIMRVRYSLFDIAKNISIICLIFTLQACNSIPKIPFNCNKTNAEIDIRHNLFPKISENEIKIRSKIDIGTYSKLEEKSVFSTIVQSVKDAPKNAKLIPVDLRFYHNVNLGNIVISNIKSDLELKIFLKTSKYSQGFFALINFGRDKITLFSPTDPQSFFEKEIIQRSDLQDVEIVLNVEGSKEISANMKFTHNQKASLLARNIKNPFRLDLREASNNQFNFGKKWIMSAYDIENSTIEGGKDTSGYYLYVNNENSKIGIHKFYKSKVACYSNPNGVIFEQSIKKFPN